MPTGSSLNTCAEDAVDDDIEKSAKTRKQVAMELYADKTPSQAYSLFTNTINPNQDYPRMGAEQALRICALAGRSTSYLRYVFDQLFRHLDSNDSQEYLTLVFTTLTSKLCSEDAEIFASQVNKTLGFKPPQRPDGIASLEGEKASLTQEIHRQIKSLHDKLTKLEALNHRLNPLTLVETEAS